MNFGERLKTLRESKGITQEELGKLINLSKANISKYEKNIHEPNIETLKFLATYFEVSIDYLLCKIDSQYIKIQEDTNVYKLQSHVDAVNIVEDALKNGLTQNDIKDIIELAKKLKK